MEKRRECVHVNAFDILEERGFLYQSTDRETLRTELGGKRLTFYVGFDPTGNSLHIGHLLPVMAMRWLQKCGHRAIALVGGGTAMVGDPSGKTEARPILSSAEIDANAEAIKCQLGRYLDFRDDRARMVNNADWLRDLTYIEFLRDVGKHFSVNRMLAAESVKSRLETGLSFLEFNYTLLQAYDFFVLCRDRDCSLQLGGQDQWGNIVAGVDLTRRMLGKEVYGATFPLLLKEDGEKFGKTAAGAVWLDGKRTASFEYYQFWRNADDAHVVRLLGFFTELPMEEVRRLGTLPAPDINRAKEILAYEATALAHGAEEAGKAFIAAGSEFGFADPDGNIPTSSRVARIGIRGSPEDFPTVTQSRQDIAQGVWIVALLVAADLCSSNGEARRLIRGGGCYIDDKRITDEKRVVTLADFDDRGRLMLRAGKKNRRRVVVN